MITRLVYVSSATEGTTLASSAAILRSAIEKNHKNGLTGVLCCAGPYFLQTLEGQRQAVNDTFQRICKDPRHTAIQLLLVEDSDTRVFHRWDMGFIGKSDKTKPILQKYSGTEDFNPYELSGKGALDCLKELSSLVENQTEQLNRFEEKAG